MPRKPLLAKPRPGPVDLPAFVEEIQRRYPNILAKLAEAERKEAEDPNSER